MIQSTVHQVTSGRRTVSAVEELEVVFGIDVINKPGINGFVRIDMTAAKVERIRVLSRNSLCFYGEAVCIGRMSLKQRLSCSFNIRKADREELRNDAEAGW